MQEYSVEKQKLVGKYDIIFKGTDIKLTEAPHLYKWNGYYYLLTAEGGTKYEHQATIARSKDLWGPYEVHPENPLISSFGSPRNPLQKAGHASMVKTHTDEWFLVHLTGRPLTREGHPLLDPRGYCPLGRETAIQRLEWKNDWPYVTGGNEPALEIEGILLTMYDSRNSLARQVVDQIRAHFAEKVYDTMIPRNVTLAEAPSYGRPALLYNAASAGAQAYLSLAKEFLVHGEKSAR